MGSQVTPHPVVFDIEEAASIALANHSVEIPLAGFFTGIIFMMYLSHMRGWRNEPTHLKVISTMVMLATLVDFILGVASLREFSTKSLKNPAFAMKILNLNIGQGVATLTTVVLTQLYFSKVVYLALEASRVWLAAAGFLMASTLAGGIGAIYVYFNLVAEGIPDANTPRGRMMLAVFMLSTCSMAVFDLLVTSVLCRLFFSSKRKATFGHTKDILTYLLVTTLETFFLTSATAVAGAILTALPLSLTGMAAWKVRMGTTTIGTITVRVYAVSLLYSLNRRAPLRARLERPQDSSLNGNLTGTHSKPQIDTIALESGGGFRTRNLTSVGIKIHTDVVRTSDQMDIGHLDLKQPLRSPFQGGISTYRDFRRISPQGTRSNILV